MKTGNIECDVWITHCPVSITLSMDYRPTHVTTPAAILSTCVPLLRKILCCHVKGTWMLQNQKGKNFNNIVLHKNSAKTKQNWDLMAKVKSYRIWFHTNGFIYLHRRNSYLFITKLVCTAKVANTFESGSCKEIISKMKSSLLYK